MDKILKFMSMAETAASYSKDRSTKVGAIALDENLNLICMGYNGFPRKVKDTEERHERPLKYLVTSHSEENLVAQAAYVGVSLRGATVLLTSLFPCTTCCRLLIQSGVKRVIVNVTKTDPKWEEEAKISKLMFKEAEVEIINVRFNEQGIWEINSN